MTHMICVAVILLVLAGCQSIPKAPEGQGVETPKDVMGALGTITQGLTNQDISEQDLKNLAVAAQNDPDTKSALQSVNQALGVQQTGIKYCPVDGQRFSETIDDCPTHHVKLRNLE